MYIRLFGVFIGLCMSVYRSLFIVYRALLGVRRAVLSAAQEWTNCTLVGHKPLIWGGYD